MFPIVDAHHNWRAETGELSMNSVMDFDFAKEQQLKGLKLFSKEIHNIQVYYYYYLLLLLLLSLLILMEID